FLLSGAMAEAGKVARRMARNRRIIILLNNI
ncbi:unnamed protein product, partial [marine sediment metagenome]